MQATTIDEAIFSFPDIGDPSPIRSTMVSSTQTFVMSTSSFVVPNLMASPMQNSSENSHSCHTGACAGCKYWVIQGFAKSYNTTIKQSRQQSVSCPYLEQKEKQKLHKTVATNPQNDQVANQLMKILEQNGQRKKRDVNNNGIDDGALEKEKCK